MYNYKNKVSKIQVLSLVTSFAIFVGGNSNNIIHAHSSIDQTMKYKYKLKKKKKSFYTKSFHTENNAGYINNIISNINNIGLQTAEAINDVHSYSSISKNGNTMKMTINK